MDAKLVMEALVVGLFGLPERPHLQNPDRAIPGEQFGSIDTNLFGLLSVNPTAVASFSTH
jgi:hypothetical protein